MQKYKTIYDYINEVSRAKQDRRIMDIATIVDKRFQTVQKNLQRANFSKLEKTAIVNYIKSTGKEIPDETVFFEKNNVNEKPIT